MIDIRTVLSPTRSFETGEVLCGDMYLYLRQREGTNEIHSWKGKGEGVCEGGIPS